MTGICSFNKYQDLVRVHQIIFDALLKGESIEMAIRGLRTSKYLSTYKASLQGSIEESGMFFDYLNDVIETSLDMFSDFSKQVGAFQDFDQKRKSFSFANYGLDLVGDYFHKSFLDTLAKQEGSKEMPIENELVFRDPTEDNNVPTMLNQAESNLINIKDIRIANPEDVKTSYYPSAQLAYTKFSKDIKRMIKKDVLIESSLGSNLTLDNYNDKVKAVKTTLMQKLTGDFKTDFYGKDYSPNNIKEILINAQNNYIQMNNGAGLDIRTLRSWSNSKANTANGKALEKYNSFVALKHFDDLIGEFSGKLISVKGNKNIETGINKYFPALDSKLRNGWRDSEIDLSALEQVSDFYKLFIEDMNPIRLQDGKPSASKSLDILTLNNSLAKTLSSIQLNNPDVSLKNSIADKLKNYFTIGDPSLHRSDATNLLTLYVHVFSNLDLESDPLLSSLFDETFLQNIKDNYDPSLYAKFSKFVPKGNSINLYESVIADMLKIDLASYGEVVYNTADNRLDYRTFLNKESDKQFHIIKNITTFSSLHSPFNYDRFATKGGFSVDGSKVSFDFGDGLNYDVLTGTFTNNKGQEVQPHDVIKVPDYNTEISDIVLNDEQSQYEDYFRIIDTFDKYLNQPLATDDYKLLDMFREMTDKENEPNHFKNLIQILSNVAFTNVLNNTNGSLNGNINDYNSAEYLIGEGLSNMKVTDLNVGDVWDSQNKRFRIELSADESGAAIGAIKEYARVLNNYYNTSAKSVTINTEGNAVPTYILATLAQRVGQTSEAVRRRGRTTTMAMGDKPTTLLSPLANNLYVKNRDVIKRVEINSGAKGVDGVVSSSSKMSPIELFHNSIRGNFLSSLISNVGETAYQPANFSDKGKHVAVIVDRNKNITLTVNGVALTKKLSNLDNNGFSVTEVQTAYLESMDEYYYRNALQIVGDYMGALTNEANLGFGKAIFENSKYLSKINPELLIGDIDANIADLKSRFGGLTYVMDEISKLEQGIAAKNKAVDVRTIYKKALNKRNGREALVQSIEAINKIIAPFKDNIINETFNNAGLDILKIYHYDKDDNNKKANQLHRGLLHNLNRYNPANHAETIADIESDFIDKLYDIEIKDGKKVYNEFFKLNLKNKYGKEDAALKAYLFSLHEDSEEAKAFSDNEFVDIQTARLKNFVESGGKKVLNPLLKRYLWENNLFGRNFHLLAVGSELGHPTKKKGLGKSISSATFKAQNKRNVIYNASFSSLYSNGTSGLPGKTKSFTVNDYEELVGIPYGLGAAVEPTDGSAICNPIHLRLVNASMYGDTAGNSLKSIQGGLDPNNGRAELLKYAEFPTTNKNVKDGYKDGKPNIYFHSLKRTMDTDFTNFYGEDLEVDITKDFTGNANDIVARLEPTFQYNSKLETEYGFDNTAGSFKDGDLVKLKAISKLDGNDYVFEYEVTSANGETNVAQIPTEVKNLFQLWTGLGGAYSVSYDQNEVDRYSPDTDTIMNGYVYDDSSMDILYEFVNSVGNPLFNANGELNYSENAVDQYYDEDLDYVRDVNEEPFKTFNTDNYTQFNVIQPLKTSLIGRISFTSGKKVGASNTMSIGDFMNPAKNIKYKRHSNVFYGMQLNAEHAVGDHDEVTEQSQIISALDFVGHSPEHALKAFTAISDYISGMLHRFNDNIFEMTNNASAKRQLENIIRDVVAKSLDGRDISGMAGSVVSALRAEISAKMEPEFLVPFSSPDVYNTVFNALSNFVSKKGVKRKLKGLAAVLKPNLASVRNVRVRNEDTGAYDTVVMQQGEYDEYIKKGGVPEILEYAQNLDYNVDMYTTVFDKTTGTSYYLDNPGAYIRIKEKMLTNPENWTIDVNASRTLKPNVFSWTGLDGIVRNNYDLPLVQLGNMLHAAASIKNEISSLQDDAKLEELESILDGTENSMSAIRKLESLQADIATLEENYDRVVQLTGINDIIKDINKDLKVIATDENGKPIINQGKLQYKMKPVEVTIDEMPKNILDVEKLSDPQLALIKNLITKQHRMLKEGFARLDLQDVKNIEKGENGYLDLLVYNSVGTEIGSLANLIEQSPETSIPDLLASNNYYFKVGRLVMEPGEILAPMIYRNQLGLSSKNTTFSTTVDSFKANLDNSILPKTNDYDMYMPQTNGSHLYIVFKGGELHRNLQLQGLLTTDLHKVLTETDSLTGKIYLIDDYGKRLSEVPSDEMHVIGTNGRPLKYMVMDPLATSWNDLQVLRRGKNGYGNIIPQFNNIDNIRHYLKYVDKDALPIFKMFEKTLRNTRNLTNAIQSFNDEYSYLNELETFTEAEVLEQLASARKANETNPAVILNNKIAKLEDLLKAIVNNETAEVKRLSIDLANRRKYNIHAKLAKLRVQKSGADEATNEAITQMVGKLQSFYFDNVLKENELLARRQYASFNAANHISAARIPGQHYQSFMGQKIVGFTDDENNIAYVSNTHMLITGEDFDIDKGYLSYYGLNADGLLPGWTTFWKDTSPRDLVNSLNLPLPTKINLDKTAVAVQSLNALSLEDIQELALANDALTNPEVNYDFEKIVNALNKAANMISKLNKDDDRPVKLAYRADIAGLFSNSDWTKVTDFVDYYFNDTSIDPTSRDYNIAYSNAIVSGIINSANDVRNLNEQLSPVSFGDYKIEAGISPKGKSLDNMSYENPLDIFSAQVAAMVGKDVIGIAAAGGLKPYSILAHNFTKVKNKGYGSAFPLNIDGSFIDNMIGAISLDDPAERVNVANYLIDTWITDELTPEHREALVAEINDLLERNNLTRVDTAFELSAILSAATDNAKELILGAINAGPETVGFYMAASVARIPAGKIAKIMTSNTVESILKYSNRNIFEGQNQQFDRVLEQLKEGYINPNSYMDINSAFSITDKLRKIDTKKHLQGKELDAYLYDMETKEYLKEQKIADLAAYSKNISNKPYYVISRLFSKKSLDENQAGLNSLIKALGNVALVDAPKNISNNTTNVNSTAVTKQMSYEEQLMAAEHNDDLQSLDEEQNVMDDEFESQEDFNIDILEFGDQMESYQTVYQPKLDAKVFLNRYLEEIGPLLTSIDESVMNTLTKLKGLKDAMSSLGKMAGVNQGIKNSFYDAYKYLNNFEVFIQDNFDLDSIKEYAEKNKLADVSDITNFLHYYFDDADFRKFANGALHTEQLNLLDLMYNAPHMQSMLHLANSTMKLNNNLQFKTRIMRYAINETKGRVPLTVKTFRALDQYANEVVITATLKKMKESDPSTTTTKGLTEDGEHNVADLTTLQGRIDFSNWFENEVLINLKDGVLVDVDGNTLEKDKNLANNEFLQALTPDSRVDFVNKLRYNYMTVRLDTTKMSSDADVLRLEKLMSGISKMKDLEYEGKKVTDLFFLYNLIIFKGRNTNGSFNVMLDSISDNYQNDGIMSKYMQMLGWIDSQMTYDGSNEFNVNELYKKGYSVQVSRIGEKPTSEMTVRVPGRHGAPDVTYVSIGSDGDYTWEELAPNVAEKYINLDNNEYVIPADYAERERQVKLRSSLLNNMQNYIKITTRETNTEDC